MAFFVYVVFYYEIIEIKVFLYREQVASMYNKMSRVSFRFYFLMEK